MNLFLDIFTIVDDIFGFSKKTNKQKIASNHNELLKISQSPSSLSPPLPKLNYRSQTSPGHSVSNNSTSAARHCSSTPCTTRSSVPLTYLQYTSPHQCCPMGSRNICWTRLLRRLLSILLLTFLIFGNWLGWVVGWMAWCWAWSSPWCECFSPCRSISLITRWPHRRRFRSGSTPRPLLSCTVSQLVPAICSLVMCSQPDLWPTGN
jgi:hypothetical protein